MKIELVGIAEIAEMLGVSRQRVHALINSSESFPEPVARLSAGTIYLRPEVEKWAKQHPRPDR